MPIQLNDRAWKLCNEIEARAEHWRISRQRLSSGCLCWDLGVRATGSLAAGLHLARVCLADLATVALHPTDHLPGTGWSVSVVTDDPFRACMASQYAGWKLHAGEFFAMGSGPMRAAAGSEAILGGYHEASDCAVGVLESRQFPTDEIVHDIASKCGVEPTRLCLLVAPTASQAGNLQVVARSVETALHKLH
ncbi:MAG: methenyltetrahydromethanopterin cyclohydrolase, partial [Planctomycetales bacterium]|nr:methenyltetrahydromethanopterin cyclohydrolase [Planctomycetales bacterium]